MDDAIRAKVLSEEDIPKEIRNTLGLSTTRRLNTMIHDVITNSTGKDDIVMSDEIEQSMFELRRFMFENVYLNPVVKHEESKAEKLVESLYEYYLREYGRLPEEYQYLMNDKGVTKDRAVCDFVSSMSDRYAIYVFENLYMPKSWSL